MTYREVQYLTNSSEFIDFVSNYNLRFKVINNKRIYLLSKCFIFEIYGLVVEDFFNFDLYSIDLKYASTLNVLLSEIESEQLRFVYQTQSNNRTQVLITKLQVSQDQSNYEFTLKAEHYFFTMLQLMDEFLSDVLSCKKEIKKEHWSDIFEFKKNELKVILDDVIGK